MTKHEIITQRKIEQYEFDCRFVKSQCRPGTLEKIFEKNPNMKKNLTKYRDKVKKHANDHVKLDIYKKKYHKLKNKYEYDKNPELKEKIEKYKKKMKKYSKIDRYRRLYYHNLYNQYILLYQAKTSQYWEKFEDHNHLYE